MVQGSNVRLALRELPPPWHECYFQSEAMPFCKDDNVRLSSTDILFWFKWNVLLTSICLGNEEDRSSLEGTS